MANYSITKRSNKNGNAFCARVRLKEKGTVTFSKSKSFHSKSAAVKWAESMLNKIEHNVDELNPEMIDCTLAELIIEYIKKKQNSSKPLSRTALYSLKQTLRYSIAKILVSKLRSKDIVDYCIQRRSSQSKPNASTLAVDISCLRKVLKVANSIFNINASDKAIVESYPALYDLRLYARSNKRTRRLEDDECKDILQVLALKEQHLNCSTPYVDIFKFSILTCCRIGEVCNLKWEDLDSKQRMIVVSNRKNPNGSLGNNSVLPLLGNALDIILKQPRNSPYIFPFNARSIATGFRRSIKSIGIKDLRYHDLRREGATRLIELGYSVEEAAKVTGHKDLNVLWQVYINIHPKHFVEKELRRISI